MGPWHWQIFICYQNLSHVCVCSLRLMLSSSWIILVCDKCLCMSSKSPYLCAWKIAICQGFLQIPHSLYNFTIICYTWPNRKNKHRIAIWQLYAGRRMWLTSVTLKRDFTHFCTALVAHLSSNMRRLTLCLAAIALVSRWLTIYFELSRELLHASTCMT